MLKVENITVFYKSALILQDVSLEVKKGELVALVGSNGAGKTTTLRAISGLVALSQGKILFQNERVDNLSPHQIFQKGIVHCPENRRLAPEMTVFENLLLGAYRRNDKFAIRSDLDWIYHLFPRLAERKKQIAGTLSGGEQQMVAIGRALMARPKMLMLDEPSIGLAPLVKNHIFEKIGEIKQTGLTVLLVEQDVAFALEMADRVYVLENGRLTKSGFAREILSYEHIREHYLGI